jgi:prephenate dehydrogenase
VATVAVIGLGLMGSSFAMALNATGAGHVVVGSDRDQRSLRKAIERGIVTSGGSDLGVVEMADIVVVAVPILSMRETFARLSGHVTGKVVTDMASTKATVMEWASSAGIELVGGHPMCGKESSGIDAADATLFQGAPWVLTADEPVVTALVEAVGARPLVMDAATHDRLVAGVSHAAFLLSVGYVLALSGRADWPEASRLAASGFRDMSRLAAGDPELYSGIVTTNRAAILEQLDSISATLARLRRHLEADDPRLAELFEEARAVRERWAKVAPS